MPNIVQVPTSWGPISDIGTPRIINILLPALAPGVVTTFNSSLEILVVLVASLEDGGRLVGATRAGHEPPRNIPAAVPTLDKTEASVRTLGALVNYVSLVPQTGEDAGTPQTLYLESKIGTNCDIGVRAFFNSRNFERRNHNIEEVRGAVPSDRIALQTMPRFHLKWSSNEITVRGVVRSLAFNACPALRQTFVLVLAQRDCAITRRRYMHYMGRESTKIPAGCCIATTASLIMMTDTQLKIAGTFDYFKEEGRCEALTWNHTIIHAGDRRGDVAGGCFSVVSAVTN